jgi:hypothetical protein
MPQFEARGWSASAKAVNELSGASYVLIKRKRTPLPSRFRTDSYRILRRLGLSQRERTVLVANVPELDSVLMEIRRFIQFRAVSSPTSYRGIRVVESLVVAEIVRVSRQELASEVMMKSENSLFSVVRSIQEFARPDFSDAELDGSANLTSRRLLAAGNRPLSDEERSSLRRDVSLVVRHSGDQLGEH